jgi:hypothetical protein
MELDGRCGGNNLETPNCRKDVINEEQSRALVPLI